MAEQQIPLSLAEWLDDLTVRFLLNLPASELSSMPRLCFQVEEAQWFYEDFVRPAVAASGAIPLPSLTLRQFFLMLCQHCPLLSGFSDAEHVAAYDNFLAYKVRIPVRGAIMLDPTLEKVLLVRGWKKGASWSFPRGKINKDEKDLDCAVREVYEETGYDARAAGILPEDEKNAKYIDITMREQHLRLFIFRDIPEDTYFEPRTRKEIGKIQWYNIRDLPGYKKTRGHGHVDEGAAASANKFYMVAPFLGQLKKYIGQERRQHTTTHEHMPTNGVHYPLAAEGDPDLEGQGGSVDLKSEELMRLLSIGQTATPPISTLPNVQHGPRTNDLLAMLQGGSNSSTISDYPSTPFEQVNAVPQFPHTPQPHHPRDPSVGADQFPPPHFPVPLQHVQQQRQMQMQTPHIFGPGPSPFEPGQASGPSHAGHTRVQSQPPFQQHNTHGSALNMQYPPRPSLNDHAHLGYHMHHNQNAPGQGFQQTHRGFLQPQPNISAAQGSQGPLGSGPAVPNASQLPQPKLSEQSMKLLDAFKTESKPSTSSAALGPPAKSGSTHSAALLNLFKKPSPAPGPSAEPSSSKPSVANTVSPSTAVAPSQAPATLERRPTLNEITRTLPAQTRRKSSSSTVVQASVAPHDPSPSQVDKTTLRQNRDSRLTKEPKDLSSDGLAREDSDVLATPITILKPPSSRTNITSPDPPRPSPAPAASKKTDRPVDKRQGGSPASGLRSGSARARQIIPPSSPLRHERDKPAFQPQLLKRPKPTESTISAQDAGSAQATDKKGQLLALFGQSPARTVAVPTPEPTTTTSPPPASQSTPSQPETSTNRLLSLFTSPQQPSQTSNTSPPAAPKLEPERKSVAPAPKPSRTTSQNLLLDLFQKPATATGSPTAMSPGTPISPFNLGTPVTTRHDPARSRLGSVTSATSSGGETPKEAKEFLMGFLNGVVRNEGQRGI